MKAEIVRIAVPLNQNDKQDETQVIKREVIGISEISPDYMKVLIPFIYGYTIEELAELFIKSLGKEESCELPR
jgi:hypothetical protein